MKTTATPLVLLASLAIALGFQSKALPKQITCPIMTSSKVDVAAASKNKLFADYKGRRYYFCCAGCPAVFKANPEKYKHAPSLPTPKAKKN